MTHRSSQADELRRALRVAIPVEDHDKIAARRARLVELIGNEIEAAPERALRKRWVTQALRWGAAAAVILAASGTTWLLAGSSSGVDGQAGTIASSAKVSTDTAESSDTTLAVATGTTVVQPATAGLEVSGHQEGREELTFPGATTMTLSGAGALRVLMASASRHEVSLHDGSLLVDVPPRPGVEKLVQVNTPHAKVLVKGTRFNVEVHGAAGENTGSTTVHVLRGVVQVAWHDERLLLERGERWSSAQAEEESTQTASVAAGAAPKPSIVNQPTASNRPGVAEGSAAPTAESLATSTLAAQNTLLVAAVRAERQGDLGTALRHVEELLERYPNSPLRATALSERRRLQALKQKD